jgi:hypothetical protein
MLSERMLDRSAARRQGLRYVSWLMVLLAAGCARGRGAATVDTAAPAAHEEPGTIRQVGAFGFGIVPDREPGTRYAPDHLPAEFHVDGMRVLFSGTPTSPPPNVRMWGAPLRLRSIRRLPAPTPSP